MKQTLVLISGLAAASGFLSPAPAFHRSATTTAMRRATVRVSPTASFATAPSMSQTVDQSPMTVPDQVGIFGRLAEAQCVCAEGGDPSIGQMEISHRGPKWIPSYVLRAPVDGGPVHVAGWVGGLFGNAEVIDYPNFAYQMQGLPFTQPFSAPQSAMAANVPSEASLRQCWVMLGGDDTGAGVLTPENIADALVRISDGDGLQYSDFDYHIRSAIDWQSVEAQPGAGTGGGAAAGDGWDAALNDQSASDMLEVNFQQDGAGILSTNSEGMLINTGVTVPQVQEEAPVQIAIAGEDDYSGNNDQLTGLDLDLGGSETGSGLWVP